MTLLQLAMSQRMTIARDFGAGESIESLAQGLWFDSTGFSIESCRSAIEHVLRWYANGGHLSAKGKRCRHRVGYTNRCRKRALRIGGMCAQHEEER